MPTTSSFDRFRRLLISIAVTAGLPDKLRNQVEAIRVQKRVREIDLE